MVIYSLFSFYFEFLLLLLTIYFICLFLFYSVFVHLNHYKKNHRHVTDDFYVYKYQYLTSKLIFPSSTSQIFRFLYFLNIVIFLPIDIILSPVNQTKNAFCSYI